MKGDSGISTISGNVVKEMVEEEEAAEADQPEASGDTTSPQPRFGLLRKLSKYASRVVPIITSSEKEPVRRLSSASNPEGGYGAMQSTNDLRVGAFPAEDALSTGDRRPSNIPLSQGNRNSSYEKAISSTHMLAFASTIARQRRQSKSSPRKKSNVSDTSRSSNTSNDSNSVTPSSASPTGRTQGGFYPNARVPPVAAPRFSIRTSDSMTEEDDEGSTCGGEDGVSSPLKISAATATAAAAAAALPPRPPAHSSIPRLQHLPLFYSFSLSAAGDRRQVTLTVTCASLQPEGHDQILLM
ncbi:uncharacterized protein [Palaemon carinicauda]|uniref:uncharacterized protein n=1 Tax=Palaemon carinicauda TaxID=392227 RepID=UPI0035B5E6FD